MSIKISDKISSYMYAFVERIINECGPRMPCSSSEKKAAELIKDNLSEFCDITSIETFICQPRAFLGFIKIDVILVLVSLICFFLIPLNLIYFWTQIMTGLSFSLNVIAFLTLWNEFFNYNEFIDPFFKKRQSQNVIGKIVPNEEIKDIIIFSGHHDSALQFNLLTYLKIGYPIIILLGLGVMFTWLGVSLVIFVFALVSLPVYDIFIIFVIILSIIGIVPLIGLFFFVTPGERANRVPGAVDNLSADAIVLGMGKFLKEHPEYIPKNTEIRLISFGCEEAGLRGAYRYVEKHLEEFRKKNVECVNMDAIQNLENISFIDFEPSTRTKHSEEVIQNLKTAARIADVNIHDSSLSGNGLFEKLFGQISGGTDATAFSKSDVKAASILAIDMKEMMNFYHQPTDTLDKIVYGSLEEVLKICIGYLVNHSKNE